MEQGRFEARLRMAAGQTIRLARDYVIQVLPNDFIFRVCPNQSYDGKPRVGDEVVFPSDSLSDDEFHGPWSVDEVVEFLWRDGKVPEWIDTSVVEVTGGHAIIALRCCGRFTAQHELLYHKHKGLPPFSIKSPVLPPGWESLEISGKFDLNWANRT